MQGKMSGPEVVQIMTMKPILLAVFLVGMIHAQTCPLEFIKIEPAQKQSWNRVGRSLTASDADRYHITHTPDFSIKVKNTSDKDIRGLKVQAAYFDATEDLHSIPI